MKHVITPEILENFSPCSPDKEDFETRFPQGFDIGALWGTEEEANDKWGEILADPLLKKHVGWAIDVGILPARIRADLSEGDLSEADLRWAKLRWADLRGADLNRADLNGANLSQADLSEADLSEADLRWANLNRADLSEADLRWARHNKYTTWPEGYKPPQEGK